MQWTHGDYTWRNIFFDADDNICGVLDFDNFQPASAGRDVMRCFTYSFPFGYTTALEYFAGYARTANLSPTEAREYVRTWQYLSTYRMFPCRCSPR
jgi:Ser/Thr protein kinase RdoA (MazF antagonist)